MKKKTLLIGSTVGFALLSLFVIWRVFFTPKIVGDMETPIWDLHTLAISLITYCNNYDSFPPDLRSLGPPPSGVAPSANAADQIDGKLASGSKIGYRFTYHPFSSKTKGPLDRFTINADPIERCSEYCVNYFIDEHGVFHNPDPKDACPKDCNHYFMDDRGVIHVEAHSPATAESPRIKY